MIAKDVEAIPVSGQETNCQMLCQGQRQNIQLTVSKRKCTTGVMGDSQANGRHATSL